jgi:hypothetical protein
VCVALISFLVIQCQLLYFSILSIGNVWDKYIISVLRHAGWEECEQWAIFYVFAPPHRSRKIYCTKTLQLDCLYCITSTQVEDFLYAVDMRYTRGK